MFHDILTQIGTIFTAIPFSPATWAVIITLFVFIWLFSKASRDPNSPVKWEHLIIDSQTDRASPYKLGFMLGMIVSTWIVVNLTDKGQLTFDILGMYLAYLLGGTSMNQFMRIKMQKSPSANSTPEDPAKM